MILKFSLLSDCVVGPTIGFGHPAEAAFRLQLLKPDELGALARLEGSAFFAGVSEIIRCCKA